MFEPFTLKGTEGFIRVVVCVTLGSLWCHSSILLSTQLICVSNWWSNDAAISNIQFKVLEQFVDFRCVLIVSALICLLRIFLLLWFVALLWNTACPLSKASWESAAPSWLCVLLWFQNTWPLTPAIVKVATVSVSRAVDAACFTRWVTGNTNADLLTANSLTDQHRLLIGPSQHDITHSLTPR